jgi:allophanate hydrolase subunit 1
MQIAPAGDRAVLIDLGEVTADELHAWNAFVRTLPGVIKSIPGHSSLYVIFDREPDLDAIREIRQPPTANRQPATTHHIPVAFDGEDLSEFLRHARLTREEFLARIPNDASSPATSAFAAASHISTAGHRSGRCRGARRRVPSRRIVRDRGTVAAFYPIDTPGGWNILGRTDAELSIAPGMN